jgi:hypothetical protein
LYQDRKMPRIKWVVPLVLGLGAGGCELIGNIGDLKQTGDGGGESDSTADGPPIETDTSMESSVSDATDDAARDRAAPWDAMVEAAMMPPDGPSTLPESGPIEASAVPDSCVPMPEDCTNGIDDNCNGLIDCADPACTGMGFQCAPPWPTGWGPVALYDSFMTSGPTPPTPQCGTGDSAYANLVAVGYYTPVPTTPTCACSCGSISLSGATCSDPVLTTASSGCPSAPSSSCTTNNVSVATIGTTCTDYTACQNGINGVNIATNAAYVGGAACGMPNGTGSVPAWNSTTGWAGAGRVCGPTKVPSTLTGLAAGCAQAGYSCLKIPANGLVCISDASQQSCPGGASLYTVAHTYNSTGVDSRSCNYASCGCTPYTSGITCTETVSVYNGSGCTGTAAATLSNIASEAGAPTCYSGSPINLGTAESAQATLTPKGGHCALGGTATVSGGITPGGTQTTVCCVP